MSRERQAPRKRKKAHNAQAVEVTSAFQRLAVDLFRTHVLSGASIGGSPTQAHVTSDVGAWETKRSDVKAGVTWRFTTTDACITLGKLCPKRRSGYSSDTRAARAASRDETKCRGALERSSHQG